MAIKKNVETIFGFEIQNAYIRVEGLQIGKNEMTFQVRSYKDNSGLPHFADASFNCAYSLVGDNPIKQAYQYLKTLPAFADATDC